MSRLRLVLVNHGLDALIVVTAVWSAVGTALRDDSDAPTGVTLWFEVVATAVVVLALLLRRRFPFAAPATLWLVAAALSFVDGQLITSQPGVYVAGLGAALLLGNLRNEAQARIGLAIVLGGAAIVIYNDPTHQPGDLVFTPVSFGIGWLVGYALRERTVQTQAAEERAARAERDREAAARVAVAEERARIARELHDVVAHAVSVMVLQVGAVRHRMPDSQTENREALQNVEQAGRTALAEMRRLLGAMRREDDQPEYLPHPGLADLDSLLDDVRAAGLAVRLQVHGEPVAPATRPRPVGVPDRPGGRHQHPQARARAPGRGGRALRARTTSGSRSATTGVARRPATASATVWWASVSGSRSSAGTCRPAPPPPAGSCCGRGSRWTACRHDHPGARGG